MDSKRWERIVVLFEQAVDVPPSRREEWVRLQTGGDTELADAVLRMLQHDAVDHLLDRPLETLAAALIQPSSEAEPVLPGGHRVGAYEIIDLLGRGGMGLVYRARDTRLDRLAALKFLPPPGPGPQDTAIADIEAEARAASALDHPNIGTIYHVDVAEDGRPFIAMAFYEGQTLEEQLAAGPLEPAQALRIAAGIAAGLGAAHDRGIVHRDVKPSNVFLTSDGGVKLLDFGIAAVAGDQVQVSARGTPRYMSPEQARATDPDPRSDVWSLGVVLFEMLAGRPPFDGDYRPGIESGKSAAKSLVQLPRRGGITRELSGVVGRALAADPDLRYPDANAMLAAIGNAQRRGIRRWGLRPWGAVIAALGAAAVGVLGWRALDLPRPIGRPVEILLADIANATGDSLFPGRALTLAAAGGLQESRHIRLFPHARVRETLARMGQPNAETTLDESRAREIAQRANLDAVLAVEVHSAGSRYLLSARLLQPTGNEVGATRLEVAGREQLLDGLDRLLKRVRRILGESRQQLEVGRRLPQVTTASLDALEDYADGSQAWERRDYRAARLHWDRAVAKDSTFAAALAALAHWWFLQGNDIVQGESYLVRALALSSRLTEREQLELRATAARYRGQPESAITASRILAEQYPDRDSWFSLATLLMRQERCAEAIPAVQRALALDSTFVNAWINLATCYQIEDQPEASLEAYAQADKLDSLVLRRGNLNQEWGRIFVQLGRPAAAESAFRGMLSRGEPADRARGHRSMGFLRMYQGRYGEAIDQFREAAALTSQGRNHISELRNRTLLAEALLTAGRRAEGRSELARAQALLEDGHPDPPYAFFLGHAWLRAGRTAQARQLLARLETEARPGDRLDQSALRLFRGFLALAQRRPRDAIEVVAEDRNEAYAGYRHAVRADAYEALGLHDSALAAAQELTAGFHFGFDSHDQWLRGALRVGRLAEAVEDSALARAAYSEYLERWHNGDSILGELRFARQRLATLQATSAR